VPWGKLRWRATCCGEGPLAFHSRKEAKDPPLGKFFSPLPSRDIQHEGRMTEGALSVSQNLQRELYPQWLMPVASIIGRMLVWLFLVAPVVLHYPNPLGVSIIVSGIVGLGLRWLAPVNSWVDVCYPRLLFTLLLIAPLLPFLGSGIVTVVAASLVAVLPLSSAPSKLISTWGFLQRFPIVALLVSFAIGDLIFAGPVLFHAGPDGTLFEGLGWSGATILSYLPSWQPVSELLLFLCLVGIFSRYSTAVEGRLALLIGALIAAIVTVSQRFIGGELLLQNQGSFWRAIERLPGTFTDPNAQGVYLAAVITFVTVPWLARGNRELGDAFRNTGVVVAIIVLIAAGLFSGSRSLFLLMLVFVACVSWRGYRRVFISMAAVGIACLVLVTVTEVVLGQEVFQERLVQLPTGIQRLLSSLSLVRIRETFLSRSVFFAMARTAIAEQGVWGIGPGAFKYYVPALSLSNGIDLKGWVDNANNFYLGFLAEYGLVGLVVAGASLRSCWVSKDVSRIELAAVVAMVLLLGTGPHIEAEEVAVLYAFCIGSVVKFRAVAGSEVGALQHRESGMQFPIFAQLVLVVVVCSSAVVQFHREHGVYNWDLEGGRYHQWLGPVAKVARACTCDGKVEVMAEVLGVDPVSPTEVRVSTVSGASSTRVYPKNGIQKFVLPCENAPHPTTSSEISYPRRPVVLLNVSASRGWTPLQAPTAIASQRTDPRTFGVRLRYRSPQDLASRPSCP